MAKNMLIYWKMLNFSKFIDHNFRNIWLKILKFFGDEVKDVKEIWQNFYKVRVRLSAIFEFSAKTAPRQKYPCPKFSFLFLY